MPLRYKKYKTNGKTKTLVTHVSKIGRRSAIGAFEITEDDAKNSIDTALYESCEGKKITNKQRFTIYRESLKEEEKRVLSFTEHEHSMGTGKKRLKINRIIVDNSP